MDKHRKAQVIIFSSDDNMRDILLLQTKKDRGEIWQPVTGSIDPGESWQLGAQRELLEETGLSCPVIMTDLEYFFKDRWDRDIHEKVFYTVSNSKKVKISDDEHQNYKWINTSEVTEDSFGYTSNFESFKKVNECLE